MLRVCGQFCVVKGGDGFPVCPSSFHTVKIKLLLDEWGGGGLHISISRCSINLCKLAQNQTVTRLTRVQDGAGHSGVCSLADVCKVESSLIVHGRGRDSGGDSDGVDERVGSGGR